MIPITLESIIDYGQFDIWQMICRTAIARCQDWAGTATGTLLEAYGGLKGISLCLISAEPLI